MALSNTRRDELHREFKQLTTANEIIRWVLWNEVDIAELQPSVTPSFQKEAKERDNFCRDLPLVLNYLVNPEALKYEAGKLSTGDPASGAFRLLWLMPAINAYRARQWFVPVAVQLQASDPDKFFDKTDVEALIEHIPYAENFEQLKSLVSYICRGAGFNPVDTYRNLIVSLGNTKESKVNPKKFADLIAFAMTEVFDCKGMAAVGIFAQAFHEKTDGNIPVIYSLENIRQAGDVAELRRYQFMMTALLPVKNAAISLTGDELQQAFVARFNELLHDGNPETIIDLSGLTLNEAALTALCEAIPRSPRLAQINLRGTKFVDVDNAQARLGEAIGDDRAIWLQGMVEGDALQPLAATWNGRETTRDRAFPEVVFADYCQFYQAGGTDINDFLARYDEGEPRQRILQALVSHPGILLPTAINFMIVLDEAVATDDVYTAFANRNDKLLFNPGQYQADRLDKVLAQMPQLVLFSHGQAAAAGTDPDEAQQRKRMTLLQAGEEDDPKFKEVALVDFRQSKMSAIEFVNSFNDKGDDVKRAVLKALVSHPDMPFAEAVNLMVAADDLVKYEGSFREDICQAFRHRTDESFRLSSLQVRSSSPGGASLQQNITEQQVAVLVAVLPHIHSLRHIDFTVEDAAPNSQELIDALKDQGQLVSISGQPPFEREVLKSNALQRIKATVEAVDPNPHARSTVLTNYQRFLNLVEGDDEKAKRDQFFAALRDAPISLDDENQRNVLKNILSIPWSFDEVLNIVASADAVVNDEIHQHVARYLSETLDLTTLNLVVGDELNADRATLLSNILKQSQSLTQIDCAGIVLGGNLAGFVAALKTEGTCPNLVDLKTTVEGDQQTQFNEVLREKALQRMKALAGSGDDLDQEKLYGEYQCYITNGGEIGNFVENLNRVITDEAQQTAVIATLVACEDMSLADAWLLLCGLREDDVITAFVDKVGVEALTVSELDLTDNKREFFIDTVLPRMDNLKHLDLRGVDGELLIGLLRDHNDYCPALTQISCEGAADDVNAVLTARIQGRMAVAKNLAATEEDDAKDLLLSEFRLVREKLQPPAQGAGIDFRGAKAQHLAQVATSFLATLKSKFEEEDDQALLLKLLLENNKLHMSEAWALLLEAAKKGSELKVDRATLIQYFANRMHDGVLDLTNLVLTKDNVEALVDVMNEMGENLVEIDSGEVAIDGSVLPTLQVAVQKGGSYPNLRNIPMQFAGIRKEELQRRAVARVKVAVQTKQPGHISTVVLREFSLYQSVIADPRVDIDGSEIKVDGIAQFREYLVEVEMGFDALAVMLPNSKITIAKAWELRCALSGDAPCAAFAEKAGRKLILSSLRLDGRVWPLLLNDLQHMSNLEQIDIRGVDFSKFGTDAEGAFMSKLNDCCQNLKEVIGGQNSAYNPLLQTKAVARINRQTDNNWFKKDGQREVLQAYRLYQQQQGKQARITTFLEFFKADGDWRDHVLSALIRNKGVSFTEALEIFEASAKNADGIFLQAFEAREDKQAVFTNLTENGLKILGRLQKVKVVHIEQVAGDIDASAVLDTHPQLVRVTGAVDFSAKLQEKANRDFDGVAKDTSADPKELSRVFCQFIFNNGDNINQSAVGFFQQLTEGTGALGVQEIPDVLKKLLETKSLSLDISMKAANACLGMLHQLDDDVQHREDAIESARGIIDHHLKKRLERVCEGRSKEKPSLGVMFNALKELMHFNANSQSESSDVVMNLKALINQLKEGFAANPQHNGAQHTLEELMARTWEVASQFDYDAVFDNVCSCERALTEMLHLRIAQLSENLDRDQLNSSGSVRNLLTGIHDPRASFVDKLKVMRETFNTGSGFSSDAARDFKVGLMSMLDDIESHCPDIRRYLPASEQASGVLSTATASRMGRTVMNWSSAAARHSELSAVVPAAASR